MLILLNIWRGIGKQPETAAPRAGIYWRYVDTFAHFGDGLTNSQKQLRQGRDFTGDMLTLLLILVRDRQTIQLPLPQG
jgi:hypothetical protein